MGSGNGVGGRRARPYRKRRPLPALIVIAILGIGAVFVWVNVISNKEGLDDAIRCEPAASPPPGTSYTSVGHGGLDDATPIPPDRVAVRVLNAGGARGQASITTESVRQLGFTQVGVPENDAAYQGREANCQGQLRFGENGVTAARTVSLIVPCVELVRDDREDASVDLAIGSGFGDVRPRPEARQVLDQLAEWSRTRQDSGGDEQSAGGQSPSIDTDLMEKARDVGC
ncbi:hypothetical protein CFN78_05695 [Amycolatopsis antarctica]|uniref:LytR/CpsA/Psr regulator C-terminal domain-containing protein n=1 Tax=Amycolatopsis antarctica TaxID=1854586 RepID=A0A263D8S7_9PSEU|nr:envelope integrity protein Cei [Amycolatopsis antarctica]OZM74599.1 hypothetical protein CFN78_05695 [Amycolatopsis antarctica]